MRCSICSKEFNEPGNNTSPLKRGKCCDECNSKLVLPLRIYMSSDNTTHALLIESNNIISYMKIDGVKDRLETLQEMVGGYIEVYPMRDKDFVFIVDEEGLIKQKEFNHLAYEIFGIKVVGNLVLVPRKQFN